ncbi:MAG: GntR family transcriptional regulator [Rhodobacteraceae bacterium]|nr:GntR family transcriptional regulator [Paracoccaceae bacterium]
MFRTIKKIRKISASQQIHAALRERIIALEFIPGQNLSRAEIAEDYGVSQTPVRDAMLRLEEDGLLHIYPQSKTEVSKIDVAHARKTQFLRLSLEIEVARRLITSGSGDNLKLAEHSLLQQKQAFEADEMDNFVALDRAFHRALFEAAEVPDLWDLVTDRSGHIDRLRQLNLPDPGKAAEIIAYHQRILDAIKAGDAETAESEVRGHLTGTLSNVDNIMQRHPEFF